MVTFTSQPGCYTQPRGLILGAFLGACSAPGSSCLLPSRGTIRPSCPSPPRMMGFTITGEPCAFTVCFDVFATSVHNPRDLPADGVEAQHLFLAQASPWIQLMGVRQLQRLQQLGSVVTQVSDGVHRHCPLRWSRGGSQGGSNYLARSQSTGIAVAAEVCGKGRRHPQADTEFCRACPGPQERPFISPASRCVPCP